MEEKATEPGEVKTLSQAKPWLRIDTDQKEQKRVGHAVTVQPPIVPEKPKHHIAPVKPKPTNESAMRKRNKQRNRERGTHPAPRQFLSSVPDYHHPYGWGVPIVQWCNLPRYQPVYNFSGRGPQNQMLPWQPQMLINPHLRNIVDFTNLALSRHTLTPFVRTDAMEEALRRINQDKIVIISGLPGSGKTCMATQMMLEIRNKERVLPMKVSDAIEFRKAISATHRCVIFIDGMFGQTVFNHDSLQQWVPLLEKIANLVEHSMCNLIITCRTSVLKEAKKYLASEQSSDMTEVGIFSNSHIIDLSKEFLLSEEEKTEFLRSYITITPYVGIDEQKILSTKNTYLGFPLLCKLLANKAPLAASDFNNILTMHLVQRIDGIYETERTEYLTLVFMALSGSPKLYKSISKNLTSKQMSLLSEIARVCFVQLKDDLLDGLFDAADSLVGVFLKYTSKNESFEFIDTCVEEAVCLSFGKRCPRIVLRSCNEEFIQKFVTSKRKLSSLDETQTCLYVPPSQYKLLAERIAAVLSSNFHLVNQICVLGESEFVEFFFNFLFFKNRLELFLDETVKNVLIRGERTILFYCENRPDFLSNILLQLHGLLKDIPTYDEEIRFVLEHFLAQDKRECMEIIHNITESKYKTDFVCGTINLDSQEEQQDAIFSGFNSWIQDDVGIVTVAAEPENTLHEAFKKIEVDAGMKQHEYLCEVKVRSDYFPRLQFIQNALKKDFGPRSKLAGKLDSVKETIDLCGTYSLYIFSHYLLSKSHLESFFNKDPKNLQKFTKAISKGFDINISPNRPTATIVILDVMLGSQAEKECLKLTSESMQVIQLVVQSMSQDELEKTIYVVNPDSIPGEMGTKDDTVIIEQITTCIEEVDIFPKNVKIPQCSCFFMDEFELPNRISQCLESGLEVIITKFSEKVLARGLQNEAVQLEKCFQASKDQQKEAVSLAAKITLSRCQAVNSFFLKDEKLHVCVDKEDAVDEKYLKEETGYEIKIDTKSNTGKLMKHIRQGHKIYNHERRSYGTLGCFGNMGDNILVGYTCAHVVRDAEVVYTEGGVRLGITSDMMAVNGNDNIVDALIDIAAFEIDTHRLEECEKGLHCPKGNAVPMTVFQGRDFSEIEHKILYKWGATTDLKHCIFDREQWRLFRNSGRRNHSRREYIIRSTTDESCGEPGDSGALVCYHNLIENSINAIFFYIGSNGDGTNEYVCCLAAEALDALHTKGKEKHELAVYKCTTGILQMQLSYVK